ncbi:cysteine hydrolase [Muricauda ruestringensis]|uniref:Cysteine hydrolase n=1 Tax=Flagellimonas aurea TaxID=2915619 RepID=A0ABS3G9D1_9FLAO|nr:cysteine hydrolase [Allomuricauda aurea]
MKTALILIDIQNDYFKDGKMELCIPEVTAQNAKRVLEKFRHEKLPIIHVKHESTRPGASFFAPGTKGSEIHALVSPIEDEKVVIKNYPNSFRETELLGYLKDKEIDRLVIVGMMSHMCVDATTRAAKDYGFECAVIEDACTTKDLEINGKTVYAEDVHNAFMAALDYYYSDVFTTEVFLKGWGK